MTAFTVAEAETPRQIPEPESRVGLRGLLGIARRRSVFGALEVFHRELGDVFHLPLPGFNPVMLVGPEASRFVLITSRDDVRWRLEGEPITLLLRHGVLVEDGESHNDIRRQMNPALHRNMLQHHTSAMIRQTDRVTAAWVPGKHYDMLSEMRKIALLILTDTLFGVDFNPELSRLWDGIMRAVKYISPGPWVVWRRLAPIGYNHELRKIDAYIYRIIAERRRTLQSVDSPDDTDDLLGTLICSGMDDELIRDQLMTMIIAGHDTSTAALAWTLYLLGAHPWALLRAQDEVRSALGGAVPDYENTSQLTYLKAVINESLRLYPPIHLGSRLAAIDLKFKNYVIPAGTRVLYSI
ncbi:MAG: cytochrome P450, partial [Chloroflexota bacterium]